MTNQGLKIYSFVFLFNHNPGIMQHVTRDLVFSGLTGKVCFLSQNILRTLFL